jgi:hypothetical protein
MKRSPRESQEGQEGEKTVSAADKRPAGAEQAAKQMFDSMSWWNDLQTSTAEERPPDDPDLMGLPEVNSSNAYLNFGAAKAWRGRAH